MLKIAGHTFLSRFIGAILSFSIIIAISQFLGPSERGMCSLYLLIVSLSVAVSEIAGGSTSVFLLKKFSGRYLQKVQMIWSFFPSMAIPFFFLLFHAIPAQDYIFIAVACWVNSAMVMQQHLFLGMQKFLIFNLSHILIPTLTLILFLLFVQHHPSKFSYYLATLLSWSIIFSMGFYLTRFRFKSQFAENDAPKVNSLEILSSGITNQLGHLVSLFNTRLIFFILPAFQLGVWSNTLSIAEGLFIIAGSLGQVLYSKILNNSKNEKMNNDWFWKAFLVNFILTSILTTTMVFLPERVWNGLFGNGFEGISGLLATLFGGIIFQSIFLLISYRLSAQGLFIKNLFSLIWGASANLVTTLIFLVLGSYNLLNGILALSIGWAVAALFSFMYLLKELPLLKEFFYFKKK